MTRYAIFVLAAVGVIGAVSARGASDESLLTRASLVFRPSMAVKGTPTTWIFRSATDDSVVTLLVDAEGTRDGATPHGYVQLLLRAQDEIRDAEGRVACARPPCSSNITGSLRVMSSQFNGNAGCLGTQCPTMTELHSDGALRLTAGGGRDISLRGSAKLAISAGWRPVCIDKDGTLATCW